MREKPVREGQRRSSHDDIPVATVWPKHSDVAILGQKEPTLCFSVVVSCGMTRSLDEPGCSGMAKNWGSHMAMSLGFTSFAIDLVI